MDVFVAKLNPAGSALMYATYLGGHWLRDGQRHRRRSVWQRLCHRPDELGTTSHWSTPSSRSLAAGRRTPSSPSSIRPARAWCTRRIWAAVAPAGARRPTRIAVDSALQAHVTGVTNSPDFPLKNASQPGRGRLDRRLRHQAQRERHRPAVLDVHGRPGRGFRATPSCGPIRQRVHHRQYRLRMVSRHRPTVLQPTRNGPSDAFAAKFSPPGTACTSPIWAVVATSSGSVSPRMARLRLSGGRTGGTFYITPGWFNPTCLDPAVCRQAECRRPPRWSTPAAWTRLAKTAPWRWRWTAPRTCT